MSEKKFTAETLIELNRLSSFQISPDKKNVLYLLSKQDIKSNKSSKQLYIINIDDKNPKLISEEEISEPTFIDSGNKIAYLLKSELFIMNTDGSSKTKISSEINKDINGFLFNENLTKLILIKSIKHPDIIVKKGNDIYPDCDKATNCYIATDLCYTHWNEIQNEIQHPFIYEIEYNKEKNDIIINEKSEKNILEKYNFECPSAPFGGIEEFDINKNGDKIYFICRRFSGKEYAFSTNTDLFEYSFGQNEVLNICKGVNENLENLKINLYENINYNISFKTQQNIIQENLMKIYGEKTFYKMDEKNKKIDFNLGYNLSPHLSPDNKMICWLSMERDGYESDIGRICVFNFETKEKFYVTDGYESSIGSFCWGLDNKTIYFVGDIEGTIQLFKTDIINKKYTQISNEVCNFNSIKVIDNENLLVSICSMQKPLDLYIFNLQNNKLSQLTFLNKETFSNVSQIKVEKRIVETFDKKSMLCWVIYPPNFDQNKKYPTLLYCEGGPQCAVNQFWSYRWNFYLMASNDYIIIAPNRRGLPGFGREWLEEISGDYYDYCMKDYLSAIDDIKKEKYVDENKLGAVGASFGGYSVYWLAGNHEKRFKVFIAHAGIFNLEEMYFQTEEMWFANWDNDGAPWVKNSNGEKFKNYLHSPHLYIEKWDTPILCIHGEKDYRILHSQGEEAFHCARIRNIPAKLLMFKDEGHWVNLPQNSLIWQREFYGWLDKWLK